MATGMECCSGCACLTQLFTSLMNCYQRISGGNQGENMRLDCSISNICNFMKCCDRCNCFQSSNTTVNVSGQNNTYAPGGAQERSLVVAPPQMTSNPVEPLSVRDIKLKKDPTITTEV